MAVISTTLTGFYLLGITVIAHIFLVNLIVGIAIIVPIFEYLSYKRNDPDLNTLAQRIFKYLAVTELVAGVWATWITIVLAGYWSTFLFIATTKLFIPITIALIGILISIPSMASYYYLWGKIRHRSHLLIGVIMIIGTLMVPIGFNYLFSFVNVPAGLTASNTWAALLNPVYPDFTVHRIFGGLVMASMAFTAIYAIKYARSKDPNEKRVYLKAVWHGSLIGIPALSIETISGIVYALTLMKYSPYISSAVFGQLIGSSVQTYFHFSWLFVVFMIVVLIIWIGSMSSYLAVKKERFHPAVSYALLVSALIGIPIGEYLNDASRYPYLVVTGGNGIAASEFINKWMSIPAGFAIAAIVIAAFLTILFSALLYWVFIKAFRAKL